MPWIDLEQDILEELSDVRLDRRALRRENTSMFIIHKGTDPRIQEKRRAWLANNPACAFCKKTIVKLSSNNCILPQFCGTKCRDAAYFMRQKHVIKDLGLCMQRCGSLATVGRSCCRQCLDKKALYQRQRIADLRDVGLCRDCKTPSETVRCTVCYENNLASRRKHQSKELARAASITASKNYQRAKSDEERRAWSKAANAAFMAKTTPEQRSEMMRQRALKGIQRKRNAKSGTSENL